MKHKGLRQLDSMKVMCLKLNLVSFFEKIFSMPQKKFLVKILQLNRYFGVKEIAF
jgi:hypothetical protein